MSKKSERLFAAMNDVNGQAIDEAAQAMEKKPRQRWVKWMGIAAALFLVTGAGLLFLLPWGGAGSGGEGSNGSSTFMSYAGPVMPLTLGEENPAITAERDITLDFAPWVPVWISNEEEAAGREGLTDEQRQSVLDDYNDWYPEGGRYQYSTDILVTDAYTLTNTSGEDQTLTVYYPFASKLYSMARDLPALTLDGRMLETTLYAGKYTGGYVGEWASSKASTYSRMVNMGHADSWEDYRDAFADGDYLERALAAYPDFSGIPVVVYEFTDPWGPEESEEIPAPYLSASFQLDHSRTKIFAAGFNGIRGDPKTGMMQWGFFIPDRNYPRADEARLLIVLGDDIQDMQLQGTASGDENSARIEAGASVRRYESDLEAVLRRYVEDYRLEAREDGTDFELYFGLLKDLLVSYGTLSKNPLDHYVHGFLEDLDVSSLDRVFYLEAEVTVPAGGSVTLTAEMTRAGSHDFHCDSMENRAVYGYDLVTELGSNLACTWQSATLEDRGQIKIVRDNFGFDLKENIRTVELDPAEEHYYLEARRINEP